MDNENILSSINALLICLSNFDWRPDPFEGKLAVFAWVEYIEINGYSG